jgi:hypothetical protein
MIEKRFPMLSTRPDLFFPNQRVAVFMPAVGLRVNLRIGLLKKEP